MTVSVFDAAKTLGHYADWKLTNLQMQKILYLAHMVYMGKHNGEPLVNDEFQSWEYGPVLPSLYHKIKFFGNNPVKDIFFTNNMLDKHIDEAKVLKEASEQFKNVSPAYLVGLTHRKDGAWDKTYIKDAKGIVIPNNEILAEFQSL